MARYSQLYLERGQRLPDSARLRRRLAYWCDQHEHTQAGGILFGLCRAIERELGYRHKENETMAEKVTTFLNTCDLGDLLDSFTVIFEALRREINLPGLAIEWRRFVGRALAEEHLAYSLDDEAVAHPFVDVEFEANRSATLGVLNEPRFGEARRDFEAAYRHLRDGEGKAAIRSMVPALETAARVLFPGKMSRLMPNEVERHFVPLVRSKYAGNQPALDAASQLLQAMKSWINSAQPYRHGQEVEEPAEPPKDFLVAFLSNGAAYLRWLIELGSVC